MKRIDEEILKSLSNGPKDFDVIAADLGINSHSTFPFTYSRLIGVIDVLLAKKHILRRREKDQVIYWLA